MLYILGLYIYMMTCKCMTNGGTVAPNACLSWPNIVKNCLSRRPDFLALPLLNGLRGPCTVGC